MADSDRAMRGRQGRGRSADDDLAPTQIPGVSDGKQSSAETYAGEGGKAWPPFPAASPFKPFQESVPAPEADVGETEFMEREPSVAVPLAWLVVSEGPGAKRGKLVTLELETTVGRTDGDLLLGGDRSVSSQHAKVRLEPRDAGAGPGGTPAKGADLAFFLYDLASTNGTFVGTKESYRDASSRIFRAELKDGDYLLIGQTTLVFKQVA